MKAEEIRKYKEFMYNEDNSHNCSKCPENNEMQGNGKLPCGQYHCWVDCHCKGR